MNLDFGLSKPDAGPSSRTWEVDFALSKAVALSKQLLTLIGARLSERTLLKIQAIINYLRIGLWMHAHNFVLDERVNNRHDVWQTVVEQIKSKKVLYLEFGVARGQSIEWWSRRLENPQSTLHGFDSFEGLPETGASWTKGQFSTNGTPPEIHDQRIRFFKGWFDEVLPNYSVPLGYDVIVINMDADLYSATIYVLRHLRPYITPGTYIYFDELNHIEHEPRAFHNFIEETGLRFRVVCADKTLACVVFQCVA